MSKFEMNGEAEADSDEEWSRAPQAPPTFAGGASVGWGPRRALACEVTSNAELLSATLACTCEVTELRAASAVSVTDSADNAGGVEVTLRVLASFKGELSTGDEVTAVVDVAQRADSRPRIASRHVLLARDSEGTVAVRALLALDQVADLIAAEEAEAAFDRAIRISPVEDADIEAARAVLRVGALRAPVVHRSFVDYLFARVTGPLMRAYRTSPRPLATGPLLAALFAVGAHDAAPAEVRARIVEGAAHLAVGAANRSLSRDVGRALLVAFLGGRADAPRMVDHCIHPVLFDQRGRARLRSWEVLSDPLLRSRAACALGEVGTERAQRLAAWLASPERAPRVRARTPRVPSA